MKAHVRLPGVIADGTRRKLDSELGRSRKPEVVTQGGCGRMNRALCLREDGGARSSAEAG